MTDYFSMLFNPFEKSIENVKVPFDCTDHREMSQRLGYLSGIGGLGVFTAAPGMGKTLALHTFFNAVNPNRFTTAYVPLTTVGPTEFYAQICAALGLETEGRRSVLFGRIHEHVRSLYEERRKPLLLAIDEAQYLRSDILDDFKILMNHRYDSLNAFSLILLGEPALAATLKRSKHDALRQRITVHYHYAGLSEKETYEYVQHKLGTAKAPRSLINEGAAGIVFSLSNGNPRIIDRLMTQALTLASQSHQDVLDGELLRAASASITLMG